MSKIGGIPPEKLKKKAPSKFADDSVSDDSSDSNVIIIGNPKPAAVNVVEASDESDSSSEGAPV